MKIVVDVVRDVAGLMALAPAWRALEAVQSHTFGAFAGSAYVCSYVQSFAPRGWLVLALREAEPPHALLGVFPLLHVEAKTGVEAPLLQLLLPLGARFAPYLEYAVEPRRKRQVWLALGQFVQQQMKVDGLLLGPFHEDSKHYLYLLETLPPDQVVRLSRRSNYVIETRAQRFEDYVAAGSRARLFKEVRYQQRRLERLGPVQWVGVSESSECRTVIEQMARWLEGRFGADFLYRGVPQWQEVYVRLAESLCRSGEMELMTVQLDGQVIGATVTLRQRWRHLLLLIAFDPDFASYSPNKILMMRLTKTVFDRQDALCLGLGQYPYKKAWADDCADIKLVACCLSEAAQQHWRPHVQWDKVGVLLNAR